MSPHTEAIADEFTRYKALGEAAMAQLGDEELVGVQIGAVVPVDAVDAQGQRRQEDDRERYGPGVECR